MSRAPTRKGAGAQHRIERLQPWLAALGSVLLHLLILLVAMLAPPITMSRPQGEAAGGSRVEVTFIGESPPQPEPVTPEDAAPASEPAESSAATPRVRSTRVVEAEEPLPADATAASSAPAPSPVPRPVQQPTPPAPATPPPTQRRARTWGQPPGMLAEDTAPVNAGPVRSPAAERGRSYGASGSEPNLEVGGFQVVYEQRSEARLRAWRDQGITEIFLPLPGAREYMVCPLETALKRESGPCRLLDPADPEMAAIGDAREVITVQQVYRRGELVWRGPRAYR
ncbi:type II toxin-antitoxin system RelE/ParE family toxin [Luteimonas sp. RD2P54]|uniref:Type II toxin-antitoxin system RelE/ParE family toxin n=1 Tax=Luteimonas endophytica TaxID=3042023 RepID=A0ABT6J4X6_9GAMM|nr:type II toxin-antitoxin system RelE/ParE family toxin [Luteimonas endophytica]MDH5821867.1 type II toxin-antitoxin system RelE/ParE family toxin [Luteimonas endophytica]